MDMVNRNARLKLREYEYERHTFTGEFVKFGHAANNAVTTVLLNEIKDESGCIVASHIWLNRAKPFYDAKLTNGDIVIFSGYVMRYKKGVYGTTTDFKICYTSHVKNISDTIDHKVPYR
jgi:hypothetical protein